MSKRLVQITADIHCTWEGLNPSYRLYVNDELFTERTWIWDQFYLEETVSIEAEPGDFHLRWELVPPHLAHLEVTNMRVLQGNVLLLGDIIRIN